MTNKQENKILSIQEVLKNYGFKLHKVTNVKLDEDNVHAGLVSIISGTLGVLGLMRGTTFFEGILTIISLLIFVVFTYVTVNRVEITYSLEKDEGE